MKISLEEAVKIVKKFMNENNLKLYSIAYEDETHFKFNCAGMLGIEPDTPLILVDKSNGEISVKWDVDDFDDDDIEHIVA